MWYAVRMVGNIILFLRQIRASRGEFSVDLSSLVNWLMMWKSWSTGSVLSGAFAYCVWFLVWDGDEAVFYFWRDWYGRNDVLKTYIYG